MLCSWLMLLYLRHRAGRCSRLDTSHHEDVKVQVINTDQSYVFNWLENLDWNIKLFVGTI